MLDEQIADACSRTFTEDETVDLARVANASGREEEVFVALLTARTSAGRDNLRMFSSLVRKHAPKHRVHRSGPRYDVRVPNAALTLTSHAVERYVERHCQGEDPEAVMTRLCAELREASPIRQRTSAGDEQWVSNSGTLFVVRRDGKDTSPVVVTVLPKSAGSR